MSDRGAEFRKSDLQIHSPRDGNWEGARPEDAAGKDASAEATRLAREAFCRGFIEKCVAEGLRAIAITDHHEGVYAYRMIAAKASYEAEKGPVDLWIFPGMELTCKDSCQALIIFDADLPESLFEKARAKLGLPADTKPENAKGIAVELLNFNIAQLQELLETDPELRDRFIIFPHVKPGGHKTVLREGFHKRFRDLPYVGGYMDRCYPDDLKDGDRRILDGEIPDWTSEKRGVFSCSDARHADFRLIGKHATWIKLASPTAESLRQAMLAPDSRIRYDEPKLPSAVIAAVTVQGSRYLRDGTYAFNQQMNSVIGGRGAGKSTLLEYVRFALGCSAIDLTSSQGSASERLEELLISTLDPNKGAVSLDILLNGASVVLRRTMATHSVISLETAGNVASHSVDEVRRLIPTQQYRQGELSELARDDAATRLLQLVTGQAAKQIAQIEARLKKNGQSLSESLAKAVRLSAAKLSRVHADTQAKLLKLQVQTLEAQLKTGDQPATPAIVEHDRYLQQQSALEDAIDRLKVKQTETSDTLMDFVRETSGLIAGQPLVTNIAALTNAFESLRADLREDPTSEGELIKLVGQLRAWFDTKIKMLIEAKDNWSPAFEKHVSEYDEQKRALQGKQSVLETIEDLNNQARDAALQLEGATREEGILRDADRELDRLREEHSVLQMELHDLIKTQIATVKVASSGLARAEMSGIAESLEARDAIRRVLDLPNMREGRIEKLVEMVLDGPDAATKWRALQDELIALVKWREGASAENAVRPTTPLLQEALDDGFMEKLRDRIDAVRVASALQATLRPRVEIYQMRDGGEIEFRRASQGEQAATLLNILMNQSTGPLIIDQPEEDLDNRIINDIIKTIRKTKNERQLILATHNANITVNGDSENVIEMVLGQRRAHGAIDEPEVRDAVTKTMEGGKDAFELRRKKYNF